MQKLGASFYCHFYDRAGKLGQADGDLIAPARANCEKVRGRVGLIEI